MTLSMYGASVPAFLHGLDGLSMLHSPQYECGAGEAGGAPAPGRERGGPLPGCEIRRLRQSDESSLPDFIHLVANADMRNRFGRLLAADNPWLCRQLLGQQNDKSRGLGVFNVSGSLVGVGCVVPLGIVGELGLLIRSDRQRRGLGRALLANLLDAAKNMGLVAATGLVYCDNVAMLRLARSSGFSISVGPLLECTVHVSLERAASCTEWSVQG
jgi:GNAT superfamily N-acetyltransferase